MGFEIGEFINGVANKIVSFSALNNVFNNPVLTAILIVIISIIIVILNVTFLSSEQYWKSIISTAGYMFISSVIILFIHNYSIMRNSSETFENKNMESIFDLDDTISPQRLIPIDIKI